MPKKELVRVFQTLLQTGRLRVAPALPHAEALMEELQVFEAGISLAGSEAPDRWRERSQDDLVLALAVALWYAERQPPQLLSEGPAVLVPGKADTFHPAAGW